MGKIETPEQLVYRVLSPLFANNAVFPVFEPAKSDNDPVTLPSAVFRSSGFVDLAAFHRTPVAQNIEVIIRAASYSQVCGLAEDVYNALRKEQRAKAISGFVDNDSDTLNFFERTFQVQITRL